MLLRSWIEAAGLRDRVGWVSVERGEQDAQRFEGRAARRRGCPCCARQRGLHAGSDRNSSGIYES
jgi:hypothetical protein